MKLEYQNFGKLRVNLLKSECHNCEKLRAKLLKFECHNCEKSFGKKNKNQRDRFEYSIREGDKIRRIFLTNRDFSVIIYTYLKK